MTKRFWHSPKTRWHSLTANRSAFNIPTKDKTMTTEKERVWNEEEWAAIQASALEIFLRLVAEAKAAGHRSNKRKLSVEAVRQAVADRKALDAEANGDAAHAPNLPPWHPVNAASSEHWTFPGNAERRAALQFTIETLQRELSAMGGPIEKPPATRSPRHEFAIAGGRQ